MYKRQIQDPNFSLGDSSGGRIKQGIFPPPIELFGPEESRDGEMDEERAEPLGEKIVDTLEQFSIESRLAEILVIQQEPHYGYLVVAGLLLIWLVGVICGWKWTYSRPGSTGNFSAAVP